jgi:hypothetical protein
LWLGPAARLRVASSKPATAYRSYNVALWQHFTDVKTVFGDVRLR